MMAIDFDSVVNYALNQLSDATHKVAANHGFLEAAKECPRELLFAATHIALIHSEASEALEIIRSGDLQQPSKKVEGITALEDEFADMIIRICMIAKELNIDIGKGVTTKHAFNDKRPWKHGGKAF